MRSLGDKIRADAYAPIDYPKIDLGSGIACQRRELRKGHRRVAYGIDWWHLCPGLPRKAQWLPLWPDAADGWQLEAPEPNITVTPEVACKVCGLRGRIVDGAWQSPCPAAIAHGA